ncbi:gamma-tubulin complex component 6-like isoform X2 [Rhopilema esculentum]|uniref:gamma-tubulin complex component 6-like isoform X2 n=1 Tax=Rhopilema esculentum TaxID=499914 RepID=UPI0031CE1C41
MAVNRQECNVKLEIKRLALSLSRNSVTEFDLNKVSQRIKFKSTERACERKAWTMLLTCLNSPYVVSQDNFIVSEYTEDSDFKIYNDLMIKAFILKVQRRSAEGLKIEELAESFKALKVNPKIIKLLLSLSKADDGPVEEDFQNIYCLSSAESGFQDDTLTNQSLSSWISTSSSKVARKEKIFFQVDLLPSSMKSGKNVFSETPACRFIDCNSSLQNNTNSKFVNTTQQRLFGALTNQQPTKSPDSLDLVLSLPEMSQDTSLIFKPNFKSISIDEGFIDDNSSQSSNELVDSQYNSNDYLQIWTDCLNSTVQLQYTWERLTRMHGTDVSTYFCESGPAAIDHLYNLRRKEASYITDQKQEHFYVSQNQLIKQSVNVLIGLPSRSFHFNRGRCSFTVDSSLRTSGVSPEALQGFLQRFAETGTHYRQLNRFTQHHSEKLTGLSGGLTLEAFVTSLRKYIDSYKHAVLLLQDNFPKSMLQLWAIFDDMALQMRFLAEMCLCSAAFRRTENAPRPKFPMGLKLLSYLYDLCIKNKSTRHYSLLLHLYKDTSLPFLRYIANWIFDGICRDPYNEFLLDVDDQFLCYRDKHYWTHGYVLKPSRKEFGMFDNDFIDQIHACGKAINLLKLTNQKHYLLQDLQRPSIGILLSTYDLERVQDISATYVARVNQAKAEDLQSKNAAMDELLLKREEQHEQEKRKILQSMKRISNIEKKLKESAHQKKFKELQRLKKQMEDDFEKRKAEKEIRLKEDKEFMKNLVAMDSEKDEETRKAREQMLAHYQELSNKAIERENRALWNLRRLELFQKRKEFLKNDELTLQREREAVVDVKAVNPSEALSLRSVEGRKEHTSLRDHFSEQQVENSATTFLNDESVTKRAKEHVTGSDINLDAGTAKMESESVDESKQIQTNHDEVEGKDSEEESVEGEETSSKEAKPVVEGDAAKNLLYGSGKMQIESAKKSSRKLWEVDETVASKEAKPIVEGNAAKNLLYGSEKMQIESAKKSNRKLWEVEKTVAIKEKTEVKGLLYPDSYEEHGGDITWQSTRGHEPTSRIKKLLYHNDNHATDDEDENTLASLTDKEVLLDFEVEPLQTDFQSMNFPPSPSLFDTLKNDVKIKETEVLLRTEDAIDHLSLEMIIDRSIIGPVYAQVKLVQTAAVEYFTDTLQIGHHFDAFRKFLLLEDGEFGHSLCNEIFKKAFVCVSPKEFCQPSILNNMINKAMQFSVFADKVESARQLTFSLKWIPDVIRTTDIASLDFLQLRYKVPWPCNIIITENCIVKYNKIFSFLLRLKMVNWALRRVWKNLKRAGHNNKAAASPQLRQLQLSRHEMQHFVNNVERYLVNQIIHISWQEFQDDLKNNVHNVDDLHKSHVGYLNRIIFRSLLSKNATPVLKIITDIFSLILKFDFQLLSSQWNENDDGYIIHSAFALMCATHKAFKEYTAFLFKVVSKLIRRGYQHHLDDFLLQVNFNGFYEHAVS